MSETIRNGRRLWWQLLFAGWLLVTALPVMAEEPVRYRQGAVAADHPLASQAGADVLAQGGSVIDAAVATSLALSVVRPESSGLGGGGFLVFWNAETQTATAWDYRERAPLKSSAMMYVEARERGLIEPSVHGILAAAVPGEIPGLWEMHRQHGKLPWAQVVAPALRLATEGVPVDPFSRRTQRNLIESFTKTPQRQQDYAGLWQQYLNRGTPWTDTDRFFSPQRPALEWLAEQGLDAYTTGPIGQALLEFHADHAGLLTAEDLQQMAPVQRQPLRGRWGDYELVTMPPPSSGGIAMLQTLQILQAWSELNGKQAWRSLPEPERYHLLTEALKHAFADRAEFLGDADFVEVPVEKLLSRDHARRLAQRIAIDRVQSPETYGRFVLSDDAGTTHFCIMDAAGNAVACTETINTTFGSYVVEPKTGIVLNNQMDDFTAIPGERNAFGLQQSAANQIAPRKKPLSSMSPTIVIQDGRAVAIAGASGGPRIITATLQVLLQMLEFDRSATAAVSAPRLHHQWQPDEILFESGLQPFAEGLRQRGHRVKLSSGLAATQALKRTADGLEPASDPRKFGRPAGY